MYCIVIAGANEKSLSFTPDRSRGGFRVLGVAISLMQPRVKPMCMTKTSLNNQGMIILCACGVKIAPLGHYCYNITMIQHTSN